MGIVAITMYKKVSERLPGKHHRAFHNEMSLVEIKLKQLLSAGVDHVFVSTDDNLVLNTNKVTFLNRNSEYCNNVKNFSDVLSNVFQSVPLPDNSDVVFTFVCCPLFSRYEELFQKYYKTGKNQIVVNPVKHYFLNTYKRPINFNFGQWHQYSQDMEPIYLFPYAGTVCKLGELRDLKYMIPRTFEYFEINQLESIDIDTLEEFEIAQQLYRD